MIVFCTSVKNRAATCVPLLQSLQKMPAESFRLNLLDWHSTDCDYASAVRSLSYRVDLSSALAADGYNRAEGRMQAYAIRPPAPEDIVFFLDADMLVPPAFCATIVSLVAPGRCYFPICYSLFEGKPPHVHLDRRPQHPRCREANGWWRKTGYGNCGLVAADFLALGGWNAELGATWGKEDDDLFARAQLQLQVVRERCEGLFHQYHAPDPQADTFARCPNG